MMSASPENTQTTDNEEKTGLPLLHSWRAVYIAVVVLFALYAALLTLLTRLYR